jgi:hypothetical protein
MCRIWQLFIFDPRIDIIETTGPGRNTDPVNRYGWVESGLYNCADWIISSSADYGTTYRLLVDGEGNYTGFGGPYEGTPELTSCNIMNHVWCCRNL